MRFCEVRGDLDTSRYALHCTDAMHEVGGGTGHSWAQAGGQNVTLLNERAARAWIYALRDRHYHEGGSLNSESRVMMGCNDLRSYRLLHFATD